MWRYGNLKEVAVSRSDLVVHDGRTRLSTLVLGHFIVEFTVGATAKRSSTASTCVTAFGGGYARVVFLAFPANHINTLLPPWLYDFPGHIPRGGRTLGTQATSQPVF